MSPRPRAGAGAAAASPTTRPEPRPPLDPGADLEVRERRFAATRGAPTASGRSRGQKTAAPPSAPSASTKVKQLAADLVAALREKGRLRRERREARRRRGDDTPETEADISARDEADQAVRDARRAISRHLLRNADAGLLYLAAVDAELDPEVALEAAEALRYSRSAELAATLAQRALEDPAPLVRRVALQGLVGRSGPGPFSAALGAADRDGDDTVRAEAIRVLGMFAADPLRTAADRGPAFEVLRKNLQHPAEAVRLESLFAMAATRPPPEVLEDVAARAESDPSPRVARAAARVVKRWRLSGSD